MKIALASPHFPQSIADGLLQAEKMIKEAAGQQAEIICFPESYIPGYPLEGYTVEKGSAEKMEDALQKVCAFAQQYSIAIIMPMNWYRNEGVFNVAHVISNTGEVQGFQTKNQLDPSEDKIWVPGSNRNIFEVNGVKFGIVICHEGFRYPETVRWAARHEAKIVFHPHFTGSDFGKIELTEWGAKDNPYYEKAIQVRALENTIYFASVNYATQFPESATALIAPDGKCIAHAAYKKPGVLIADISPEVATGLLAKRFKPGVF